MITTIGRRSFLTALSVATAASLLRPRAARAQAPYKIGLLDAGVGGPFTNAFTRKLGELGYAEGKNVVIVREAAEGATGRLKDLAADLVAQRVAVIVSGGTPGGAGRQAALRHDPHRVRRQQRSGGGRPGREPLQARRQCHRHFADGA